MKFNFFLPLSFIMLCATMHKRQLQNFFHFTFFIRTKYRDKIAFKQKKTYKIDLQRTAKAKQT